MRVSQDSHETLFGRFESGNELIQTMPDYKPLKVTIQKGKLTAFIADVEDKNEKENISYLLYREKVKIRKQNGFRDKYNLENCLENRIRSIMSYVGVEIGCKSPAYKRIKDIIKKIDPIYKKNDSNVPKGEAKSPAEKSFAALISFGKQVSQITAELGAVYHPNDTDINPVKMLAFCAQMKTWSKDIASAKIVWKNAVKNRKEIYDGKDGMKERIVLVKDYVESFANGKKHKNYVALNILINGK